MTRLLLLGRPMNGYGDGIQAARYVSRLVPEYLGPRTLCVAPSLARLFQSLGVPIAATTARCGSLTNNSAFVGDDVLLQVDPPRLYVGGQSEVRELPWPLSNDMVPLPPLWYDDRIRLPRGSGPRVGICWTGQSGASDYRAVPAALLRPLLVQPGIEWVALHLADELQGFGDHSGALGPIVNLAALGVRDWADTAGVIQQLDLVITVDTAVAHLAGSLGVATWLLLIHDHCARWGRADTTPLYPSIRIFRQETPGNWAAVIEEVRRSLANFSMKEHAA